MVLWLAWKKTVHLIEDSAKVGKTEYAKEQKSKKKFIQAKYTKH